MHDDPILDRRLERSGPAGRLLFLMSLWMSLATAIICAIVPVGLPLTRTTGSAFDPSTTVVALRSRPPAPIKAVLLRTGEGDTGMGDSPAAFVLPAAPAARVALFAPIAAGIWSAVLAPIPAFLPIALYARPPPSI